MANLGGVRVGKGEEWIKVLYFNKEQESECKDQAEISKVRWRKDGLP